MDAYATGCQVVRVGESSRPLKRHELPLSLPHVLLDVELAGLPPSVCSPHRWGCPLIMRLDPVHVAWTCARCGVVAIPTSVFYDDADAARTLVRFAFCKREEVIAEAARRLAQLAR